MRKNSWGLVFLLTALVCPFFASADEEFHHGGPPPEMHGNEHWHGDIHQFHEGDIHYWHSGQWIHGPHSGRDGWWWVLGDDWYYYPAPIYPYPDPYVPPVVVPSPQVRMWYWCPNPRGYYPYIPACAAAWRGVPAY